MIAKLELSNFRKHQSLSLDFTPGLNSITGPNSAGKTNVLRGILYCLFGPTATGCPKDRLWRRGRGPGEPCFARLTLAGGVEIYRGDAGATVRRDGKLLAGHLHTGVTRWVEERFGMRQADLTTLMYSAQGDAQQILAMGATGLQRQVERLSGIEAVDRVLGLIGPDLGRAEGALEAAGGPVDLTQLAAEAKAFGLIKAGADAKRALAGLGAADAAGAREAAQRAWQEAVAGNAAYDALLAEERRAASVLEGNAAVLRMAEADEDLKDAGPGRAAGLRAQLAGARKELEDVEGRLRMKAAREEELASTERWLKDNRPRLAEQKRLEAALEEAREGRAGAQALLAVGKESCDDLRAVWKKAVSVFDNAACPECGRAFEGFDPAAAEAAMDMAKAGYEKAATRFLQLEGHARVLDSRVKGLEAAMDHGLEREVARNGKLALDLAEAIALPEGGPWPGLGDAAAILSEIKDVLEPALEEAIRREEKHAAAQRRLGAAVKAHGNALLAFAAAQGAVEATPPPQPVDAMLGRLEACRDAESAAAAALGEAENLLGSAMLTHGLALANLEMAQAAEEKRLAAKKAVDGLSGLQKYLRGSRARLSAEIWGGLLDYASYLAGVATSGRMGRLARSEKGEFAAGGIPVDDDGGAMKSLVGLALRVSLARTFYGAGLPLLLDEPSADASDSTANAITGMLMGLGSQIISVTHRTDAALGNVIVLDGDEPSREVNVYIPKKGESDERHI